MSYQIHFEASTGRTLTLEVGGHEGVEAVRSQLEPFVGVPLEEMKFFYLGQQVLIGHPFLEYNIEDGGSMMLVCDDDQSIQIGGARNTGEFRTNIYSGLLPQKASVTYEGVFNDFSYQTESVSSVREVSSQKVSPQCSFAKITNPVTKAEELYMSVGLNSIMTRGSVRLPNLNVVVVLDTSSSMSEPLNKKEENSTTKHSVSKESVLSLLSSLHPENNFGIVTFDDKLQILQPISTVGSGTELVDLKEKVLSISSSETCDLRAGYEAAVELIHPFASIEKENRIVIISDKIPNHPNDFELLQNVRDATSERIYTTIIGVGQDITNEVKKQISEIKGANSASIANSSDASKLADELEAYLVPLAFGLSVKVSSEDLSVEEVYGADFDPESGLLLNFPTLFPTLQDDNGYTKGGVVLLRLKPTTDTLALHPTLKFSLVYESRNGEKQTQVDNVDASQLGKGVFGSNKIRKAIALALYTKCLKSWIEAGITTAVATRAAKDDAKEEEYQRTGKEGIPLKFTSSIADEFSQLRDYILTEANKLMDPSLDREVDILSFLLEKIAQGKVYYEPQSEPNTCFRHAINMYFQKQYINDDFLTLYCELLRSSSLMITKLKSSGAKATCYGSKLVNEKFLNDSNSDPIYDEDLFSYFEIYKAMQVEDFIKDITTDKLKELSPLQALFFLEFSMSILPSAGGGHKALLYYTPHSFLHRYSRNTSARDQLLSQQRFCDSAKVSPKMFLCHLENGKSHAFAAMNQLVPSIRAPSLNSSAEIPFSSPVRALNLSGIPQTPVATPASTPRETTPTSTPRDNTNPTPYATTPRDTSASTTPRDTTAIPFDLEIVNNMPPVPPSKSVWSTIFGFAFGPFASCVFPQCAPKYEEKATEMITVKAEPMNGSAPESKNPSPAGSKNNSGRSSPVTTNGNTENGEYITSSTPPKAVQLQKQTDAEELEWILLDSLVGTGLTVPDLKTMFSTYNFAGRASVAILPDTQREPILIGRKNINLPVIKE